MSGENNGRRKSSDDYWRANLKLLGSLLAVWFIVSFGFGILLEEPLNAIPFFGFKLGFWFAQQGSIYVFVALIFIYARKMKQLDLEHDVHD
jgi:putative solute:sodium symporter small subunit